MTFRTDKVKETLHEYLKGIFFLLNVVLTFY